MPDTLESRTQTIGREIFAHLAAHRPWPLSPSWWDERFMAMGMSNEAMKLQLFRFVDVLPALRSPQQISTHLREYLGQTDGRWMLGEVLRHLPNSSSLAQAAVRRLARRFIAGSDLPEALATIDALRRRSMTFTIDLLGEAVLSEREADEYQRQYLHLIAGLADAVSDRDVGQPNVSIKLSSLYSQFDPIDPEHSSDKVRQRLRPILRLARQRGVAVNIDMEQFALKDLTLRIFREALDEDEFRDWPDAGIAIQAYLRSTADDLRDLALWARRRGTPVTVRLVKGAYWDYEMIVAAQQNWPAPVFTGKAETDASFEAMSEFLIQHHAHLRPAIASHNVRSIGRALALIEQYRLPPRHAEFQLLYGMADPIKEALVASGQRVRVYTPFGKLLPGMAYLVRRLLENTSNQSFLRAGFLEHAPMEKLLMNPMTLLRPRSALRPTRAISPGPFVNEPLADFSRQDDRQAMQAALDSVREQLGKSYTADGMATGESASTSDGTVVTSLNPSHKAQVIGRCAAATAEQVRAAITAAAGAFPAWRDTSPSRRAAHLIDAANILRRRRYELAAWEVYECGKPWREADADVAEAIDYCEFYAREMLRLARPQTAHVPGEENDYFYEPRGVSIIIAPWNFPLAILCGMTAAAIVAGNTAIMKPAEQSTIVGAKLMEVFREAQFPPGVVNCLSGIGEEIGPALIEHPDVALVAFTGSRSVGLSINQLAALTPPGQDHIKRVILELGGKNAIIIDDDADLDEACRGVAASAFGYAGQKCSACSRAIVLDSIHDAFLDRLIEVTRSLRIAPAEDPSCFVGPVIDEEAFDRVQRYIDLGRREARLAYAGDFGQLAGEGFYIPPHIFADVPSTATIAREEIFGPVLAVMRAGDLDQALRIANDTSYALTGGLYSRSPGSIARIRREFRVGNLYINRRITGALVSRQPFGGQKLSGTGSKAGGSDYLLQFMLPRTITENTLRRGFAPTAPDDGNALI